MDKVQLRVIPPTKSTMVKATHLRKIKAGIWLSTEKNSLKNELDRTEPWRLVFRNKVRAETFGSWTETHGSRQYWAGTDFSAVDLLLRYDWIYSSVLMVWHERKDLGNPNS